jgi:hypothetical protein
MFSADNMKIEAGTWISRFDFLQPTSADANLTRELRLRDPVSSTRLFDTASGQLLHEVEKRTIR